ncbi:hypothetical protein HGRIS_009310 [Hohenbuehelia grisea]|uniref:DNA mismatch repair protein S5 domain-containing protein n=1 Tax=Hohenbuehelia grisea TaxID=104357 RepID=A0ABR3J179_9AGAR
MPFSGIPRSRHSFHFFKLPIRRLSHPSIPKTIELIKNEITTYALASHNVAFSLERVTNPVEQKKEKVLRIPQTASTLAAFRQIYGRALVEHVHEVHACQEELRLDGFISLVGAHSKSHQFLYINRHPIGFCELHRTIDLLFSRSTFGKHAFDDEGESSLRPEIRRSPRKSEKKPVYVLNLWIPPRLIDNCMEPSKSQVYLDDRNQVQTFLASEVQNFLIRHGFISQRLPDADTPQASPSPRKRRKVYQRRLSSSSDEAPPKAPPSARPLHEAAGDDTDDDARMLWKDPVTGEVFFIDKRTGNSYPQRIDRGDGHLPPAGARRTLGLHSREGPGGETLPSWIEIALKANQAYALTEKSIPSAGPSMVPQADNHSCSAHNPLHHTSSHRLFAPGQLGKSEPTLRRFLKRDLETARILQQIDRKFIACLMGRSGSELSSLGEETNVRQQTLVLIDQHAADERIRVERFLRPLCLGYLEKRDQLEDETRGTARRQLSPARPVLLASHEASQLSRSSEAWVMLNRWGIEIGSEPRNGTAEGIGDAGADSAYVQVEVLSVPDLVADKLLLGDELRDLIKGFLGMLQEENFFASQSPEMGTWGEVTPNGTDGDDFSWLKALRYCPRELLELINSKACRG